MRLGQTSAVHFASQLAASVVGFLATVYLVRKLGESVLGTYFLFMAVLVWLKIAGNNGIRTALIKRLSEAGEGGGYLSAGVLAQLGVFVILAVAVFLARGPLEDYLGFAASVPLIALLFAGFVRSLVAATLEGQHRVHVASLLDPLDRTLRSALQIGAAVVGFGLVGLFAGYALAGLAAALVGVVFVTLRPTLPDRADFERIGAYARYSWLTGVESRAFASMDTLVLGVFVSTGLIAVYEIAWNLASVLAVFGASVAQSLFPAMSEVSSRDDPAAVAGLVEDALAYAGLFVVPGLVGALVVGEAVLDIYRLSYPGSEGVLVLAVLVFARLVYVYESQFVSALGAVDRPDAAFRVNAAFVATNLGLNVALVYAFGWLGAAVATAVSAAVGLVLGYRALARVVAVRVPVAEIGRQWLAAAAMGAAVYAGEPYLGGTVGTVVLVGSGGIVYFAALSVLSARFRSVLRRNLPVAG